MWYGRRVFVHAQGPFDGKPRLCFFATRARSSGQKEMRELDVDVVRSWDGVGIEVL